eukprot:1144477-Pelagomonas_calceolata.AAC.2
MTAGVMQQQQEVLTSKMQEVMDSMRQWVSGSGNGTSRQELLRAMKASTHPAKADNSQGRSSC